MPSFYCIHDGFYSGIDKRLHSLRIACSKYNVPFKDMDSQKVDFTDLPLLKKGDMLYNAARGGETLESLLIRPFVKTFYVQNPMLVENNGDTIKYAVVHDKLDIPTPKTIFRCHNNKKDLKGIISQLGGFPVVLKIHGGTKGVGTMIFSDYPSFYSVTDYFFNNKTDFILRTYIPPKEIARLIVVGNEVVAANIKHVPPDDFRTSVDYSLPIPKKYSSYIEQVAIKAAISANLENCGVDILIDKSDHPYVLEVNMPHDFSTVIATGNDIADKMIQHILSK